MYVSKVYETAVDSYGDVRTLVRGLPYQCPDDWEDVLDSLDEDSNLYLVKEPDNPKDKLAIAAYLDDRRVGYVAASDNGKIWLYLTEEKMPCKFIERFDASFKISFENPRHLFEDMPFAEIYKDKYGVTEQPFPAFEIPFLTNPKDESYNWFDDKIFISDLERAIPDFRRKLASRMIIIAGRKDSNGEYNYYLPYANNPIADVEDGIIRRLVDRYGFVIALPDVPRITKNGAIIMDLHVTYLKSTDYKDFDSKYQSELVFSLTRDFVNIETEDNENEFEDVSSEDNVFEETGLSAQNYQLVKYNFKEDYALKKGESINYHVVRKYYDEIDKITTDLYTFVRQKLFPSNELFLYLRKHTPYGTQFYNYDDFEALIKIFVIKDLGRVYMMHNHSINFDTQEGKVLFLYMTKEAGNDSEGTYEIFAELCNPNSRFEAAIEMRQAIENLMKSYYDYDIALWTDDDFMIHSFLKEIDAKLAQRYKTILNRIASAVDKAGGNIRELIHTASVKVSHNSTRGSSSSINDFFPIWGITLGETTLKQAKKMGYVAEKEETASSSYSYIDVEDIRCFDDNGSGVFSSLMWGRGDSDFSPLWRAKGFSWDNSYDEWMNVFKKLGFKITVTKQPCQGEFCGHKTLSAEFNALSPDELLLFELEFDYGESGHYTSSPKSLDTIWVTYKG